jgi:hypothetical protein
MQLYRSGNYIVRESRYNEGFEVWNMRTMVQDFETSEAAIKWIDEQMKNK